MRRNKTSNCTALAFPLPPVKDIVIPWPIWKAAQLVLAGALAGALIVIVWCNAQLLKNTEGPTYRQYWVPVLEEVQHAESVSE